MGHRKSLTYAHHYINQHVQLDTVSTFLQEPSKTAIMQLATRALLTCDANAPTELTDEEKQEVSAIPEVEKANLTALRLREQLISKHRFLENSRKTDYQAWHTYQQAYERSRYLRNNHGTALLRRKRKEFFRRAGSYYFALQEKGADLPDPYKSVEFEIKERSTVRRHMQFRLRSANSDTSDTSETLVTCGLKPEYLGCQESETQTSVEIWLTDFITSLVSLSKQKTLLRKTASRVRRDPQNVQSVGDLEEEKPLEVPLACGNVCLFCLGDHGLSETCRLYKYSSAFNVTRHVYKQHLCWLPEGQHFECPHPICRRDGLKVSNIAHFFKHALAAHQITHSTVDFRRISGNTAQTSMVRTI